MVNDYYDISEIKKEDAQINIIFGERSNGKSFQIKHEVIFPDYFNFGWRSVYLRRIAEEIGTGQIEDYFKDVDVRKLTKGKENCISQYRKRTYLSNFDSETLKVKRVEQFGYAMALSTEQNYAGGSYLDVHNIVYEEFMTRTVYLAHEPSKLMNLYCTIDRKRGTTKMWLLGNTISRVCPYIHEWGLDDIFRTIKQGEIKTKYVPTGEIDDETGKPRTVKIAIEYCRSTGRSSYTIGSHSDMMNTGSWQTDPQPLLPKSLKKYKCKFRFGFQYQNFKFLCDYLYDAIEKEICFFIYPYTKDFNNKTIVFSDRIKMSKYWQRNIYDISIPNKKLRDLFMSFKENKIFYASDICGTDFKQVKDFDIRR